MKMEPAKSFLAEQQVADLSKPSLAGLSYALRHPDTWPSSFKKWYYGDCATCAMGLTCALWKIGLHNPHNMTRAFGINDAEKFVLFCTGYRRVSNRDVTPEMVADRIDEYLAKLAVQGDAQ